MPRKGSNFSNMTPHMLQNQVMLLAYDNEDIVSSSNQYYPKEDEQIPEKMIRSKIIKKEDSDSDNSSINKDPKLVKKNSNKLTQIGIQQKLQFSESGSRATRTTSSSLKKSLQSRASSRMLQGYYTMGLAAMTVIVIVSVLHYIITNTAMIQLFALSNMNLHPTQVASFINVERSEILKRASVDNGLFPSSLGAISALTIEYYYTSYLSEFQSILNDTDSLSVVSNHIKNNLVEIYDPIEQQTENYTLITAIGQLESWNIQEYTAVLDLQNTSLPNFYPRRFFDVNVGSIQDNLLLLMSSVQDAITQQYNSTVSLRLIVFMIGTFVIFAVLIFFLFLYRNINNKKYKILVVFCKISKKDLENEIGRLLEDCTTMKYALEADKNSLLMNKASQKKGLKSERMFTNYIMPSVSLSKMTISFFFLFGTFILPFLISYLKLLTYTQHWMKGIEQYKDWEIMRTNLVGSFSDAHYVYFESVANSSEFNSSLIAYNARLPTLQEYIRDFDTLMSEFGMLSNQDLYTGDIADALKEHQPIVVFAHIFKLIQL